MQNLVIPVREPSFQKKSKKRKGVFMPEKPLPPQILTNVHGVEKMR